MKRFSNLKLSSSKGFSLLEVVVSMGLFSVGLLSIIQLQLHAHAVIADSSLKSQALAYASSRHEIHTRPNAQVLADTWEQNIKTSLPDIKITSQLSDDDLSLSLSWETNQMSVGCLSQGLQLRDCLQL